MTIPESKRAELAEAAAPLIKWLRENTHPHCTAIATQSDIEITEGLMVVKFPFADDRSSEPKPSRPVRTKVPTSEPEEGDYLLYYCDQTRGRDWLSDWGNREDMFALMGWEADKGNDVWVVDPSKTQKFLPDGRVEPYVRRKP